jgi:hypothetical protein
VLCLPARLVKLICLVGHSQELCVSAKLLGREQTRLLCQISGQQTMGIQYV